MYVYFSLCLDMSLLTRYTIGFHRGRVWWCVFGLRGPSTGHDQSACADEQPVQGAICCLCVFAMGCDADARCPMPDAQGFLDAVGKTFAREGFFGFYKVCGLYRWMMR